MDTNVKHVSLVKSQAGFTITPTISTDILGAFLQGIANQLGSQVSYSVVVDPYRLMVDQNVMEYILGKIIKKYYPSSVLAGKKLYEPEWVSRGRRTNKTKIYEILGSGFIVPCPYVSHCFMYITIDDTKDLDASKAGYRTYTITFLGTRRIAAMRELDRRIRRLTTKTVERANNDSLLVDMAPYGDMGSIPRKRIENVFLNAGIKEDILTSVNLFKNEKTRQLYMELEEPYHLNILLYGNPGTGKNSIVYALCDYLKIPTVSNLSAHVNFKSFSEFQPYMDSGGIVLIDEIDTLVTSREELKDDDEKTRFKNLLYFLDNVSNETIVICCTNYIDRLDPALIRSGRFNKRYEITDWSYNTLQEAMGHYKVSEKKLLEKVPSLTFAEENTYNPAQMMDAIKQIRMEEYDLGYENFHTTSATILEQEGTENGRQKA